VVTGLNRFREHFRSFSDRYVLIGGTACDLAFTNAGVSFRATKDLDIVLCVEALDASFARAFWQFVKLGEYEIQQAAAGEKKFYRFKKPKQPDFPVMLELFARVPDALGSRPGAVLTPLPIDDDVSSLSAILLDADYYQWIHAGKQEVEGLPILRPEYIIPLKARAWLDLTRRAAAGEKIDSGDIKKHKNDVFRLFTIIEPDQRLPVARQLEADMKQFLLQIVQDPPDLKALGLKSTSIQAVLEALRKIYADGPS
jgi:hypothetical protein